MDQSRYVYFMSEELGGTRFKESAKDSKAHYLKASDKRFRVHGLKIQPTICTQAKGCELRTLWKNKNN